MKYLARSKYGYWRDGQGWVASRDEATRFAAATEARDVAWPLVGALSVEVEAEDGTDAHAEAI